MLVDYHLHSARCGHASGTMLDYVNAARKMGLEEIGFADHVPMYWLPEHKRDLLTAMDMEDLPGYIEEVQQLTRRNLDITIKLGLEVDYIPGYEKEAERIISSYPLDYVLGSVHFLDDWGFDNPAYIGHYREWDLFSLYKYYFSFVCQAATSGLFDVIAHVDLIKKFGYQPEVDLNSIYQEVARTFAASGVCAEINTAGLRVPIQEIYPATELIRWLYKYNVPVTIGSDAHNPQQVGQDIDYALNLLKKIGYEQIVLFKNRKRKYINI